MQTGQGRVGACFGVYDRRDGVSSRFPSLSQHICSNTARTSRRCESSHDNDLHSCGPHALACPRDAMTGRDLCSLLLRLMGVYYAFGAAFQLIAGLSYLSMRLTGSMDTPAAIVSAQFASMLVHIVACYLLIVRADALTDHLFPKDQ